MVALEFAAAGFVGVVVPVAGVVAPHGFTAPVAGGAVVVAAEQGGDHLLVAPAEALFGGGRLAACGGGGHGQVWSVLTVMLHPPVWVCTVMTVSC